MDIKLYLPDSLLRSTSCFVRGHYALLQNEHAIYITDKSANLRELVDTQKLNAVYGRFGRCGKLPRDLLEFSLDIDSKHYSILKLTINGELLSVKDNHAIVVFYDYETLCVTENWKPPDKSFEILYSLVGNNKIPEEEPQRDDNEASIVWKWFYTLYFCVQLKNFFQIMKWMWKTIRRDKKITFASGNMLTALAADIAVGCLVLSLLDIPGHDYTTFIMGYIETVVSYLRSILKWLMGAPAGLKLNKAFNNMLGRFFLYHIDLWWMFLDLTKGGLNIVSQLFYLFGFLGVTFQAAIISDMISFISFHAYCIYVYVARLFNIQVSGLTALLRLFVGRKWNPLRGGVDSCEYTNQELFVGTVAFTILLFLLPTTAMYYFVFTLFRLLSIGMKGVLSRVCYTVKTLPLYVLALYLVGSPRVAGNIHMEVMRDESAGRPLVLSVRLTSRPLGALVSRPPPVAPLADARWTRALADVFNGTLIN